MLPEESAASHQPTGVRFIVAMGRPAQIHHCIQQQQPGALVILLGIENYLPIRAFRPHAGIGGLYRDRAPGLLRPGRQVQRMQALMVVAAAVLAGRHHVDGPMRSCLGIDDWSGGHANFRRHLAATLVVSPVPRVDTCHSTVPESASKA